MKTLKILFGGFLAASVVAMVWSSQAADQKPSVKPYPLKTCLVTGEELGGMGDPYVLTNRGWEIKLCCKGCLKKFEKDAATYIQKLEEAAKARK